MRICIVSIVMFSILTTNASSHAQVEVVVPDAVRVKTTAKVENGVLGVANSFTSRLATRRCRGMLLGYCHKTKTWLCRDFGLQPGLLPPWANPRVLVLDRVPAHGR